MDARYMVPHNPLLIINSLQEYIPFINSLPVLVQTVVTDFTVCVCVCLRGGDENRAFMCQVSLEYTFGQSLTQTACEIASHSATQACFLR